MRRYMKRYFEGFCRFSEKSCLHGELDSIYYCEHPFHDGGFVVLLKDSLSSAEFLSLRGQIYHHKPVPAPQKIVGGFQDMKKYLGQIA